MTRRTKRAITPTVDLMALSAYVDKFSSQRVVLLGDFVADVFQSGDITRVSREAPVLILKHRETRIVPGGGANAANNFAALGAEVHPVTIVGDDEAGEALFNFFRAQKTDTSGILRQKGSTTPRKTRFLAGWAHKAGQQVLRVDYEPTDPPSEAVRKRLHSIAAKKLRRATALAVSDYGFGIVAPGEIRALLARHRGVVSAIDSRYRLADFASCGFHSATPNEAELEAIHHASIGKDVAALERCGHMTLSSMKLRSLLVTRGRDGMALFEPSARAVHIPIHGTDEAVDVTGAGDTVLATYTLGLAAGASPFEAAHLANIAGGLVVMKSGTATISRHELQDAIAAAASEANP